MMSLVIHSSETAAGRGQEPTACEAPSLTAVLDRTGDEDTYCNAGTPPCDSCGTDLPPELVTVVGTDYAFCSICGHSSALT